MYESQYGFRKNMSTSLALLELVENITTSMMIVNPLLVYSLT